MFNRKFQRATVIGFVLLSGCLTVGSPPAWGQVEVDRAVKTKVSPAYPELARRMNLVGVVRVEVTVAANGSVKTAKLIGGHPVLANAALDAVKKWHFETGSGEITGVVQFRFDPAQ